MLTRNSPIWGVFSYLILISVLAITVFWPPELWLVLDRVFWASVVMFALCIAVIFLLFWTQGGSSRNAQFSFGILLILAAAIMNSGFEQIIVHGEKWAPRFPISYTNFFIIFKQVITYARDVVAFGIAALGANIMASAILKPKKGADV